MKILICGVGGAGGNMIDKTFKEYYIPGIDFLAINTDSQALEGLSSGIDKIVIGETGLGAGMKPEVAKKAVEDSYEKLSSNLGNYDLAIVVSGLGGGTGSGASPLVTKLLKEKSGMVLNLVTTPFVFEGKKRTKISQLAIKEIEKETDSVFIVNNDKILTQIGAKTGIKESLNIIDNVLAEVVVGIVSTILTSEGEVNINIDYADFLTVLKDSGHFFVGTGVDNSPIEALKNALDFSLTSTPDREDISGVVIHFQTTSDKELLSIQEAVEYLEAYVDSEIADIIFGVTASNSEDNLDRVTVVIGHKPKENMSSIENNLKKPKVVMSFCA